MIKIGKMNRFFITRFYPRGVRIVFPKQRHIVLINKQSRHYSNYHKKETGNSWLKNEIRLWTGILIIGGGIFTAYKYGYREKLPAHVHKILNDAKEKEDQGRYKEAIKLYTKASNVVKASPFLESSTFIVISRLGDCLYDAGETKKAIEAYQESLTFLNDIVLNDVDMKKRAARVLDRLGQIALESSDVYDAEKYYIQALDVLKVPIPTIIEVTKLWEESMKKGVMNEMKRPSELVSRIQPIGLEFAGVLNNLAMLYLEHGEEEKALSIFHRCYAIMILLEKQDDKRAKAVLSYISQIQENLVN